MADFLECAAEAHRKDVIYSGNAYFLESSALFLKKLRKFGTGYVRPKKVY